MINFYFFSNEKEEYLVYCQGKMAWLDPELDRNELDYLVHATGEERAQDWLNWLRKERSHRDLPEDLFLEDAKVVCFVRK